jgi:hypothetical protein
MTLSTKLRLQITAALTGAATDLAAAPATSAALNKVLELASGVGASQADKAFADTRTLGASATEDLDLAGSLTDPLGTTVVFATIKAVIVVAASGNTNNVNVTRPASNGVPLFLAAGDGLPVKPDGAFLWVAPGVGVTVTAATGDLLTFTNSGGTTGVTYTVVIIGTSA